MGTSLKKRKVFYNLDDMFDYDMCSGTPSPDDPKAPVLIRIIDMIHYFLISLKLPMSLKLSLLVLFSPLPAAAWVYRLMLGSKQAEKKKILKKRRYSVTIFLPGKTDAAGLDYASRLALSQKAYENIFAHEGIFNELSRLGAEAYAVLVEECEVHAWMNISQMLALQRKHPHIRIEVC